MSKSKIQNQVQSANNNERKKRLAKFLGIFVGVIVLYYIFIISFGVNQFDSYLQVTAKITSIFMSIFNKHISATGTIIGDGSTNLILSFGCEGTAEIIIFVAGVLAFPSDLRKKLIGLSAGVLFLYFMNLFRIMGLFNLIKYFPSQFELFHAVIFPIIYILLSLLLWGLWIRWNPNSKTDIKSESEQSE